MGRIMTHESALAALPNGKADAKPLMQIAEALGLETSFSDKDARGSEYPLKWC